METRCERSARKQSAQSFLSGLWVEAGGSEPSIRKMFMVAAGAGFRSAAKDKSQYFSGLAMDNL